MAGAFSTMEMMTMTIELLIPNYIQPLNWELFALELLDGHACGFDPEAVAKRSALLSALLEETCTNE